MRILMMRASMRLEDGDDITVLEEEDYDDVTVIIMSVQGKDLNDVTEVGRGEKEEKEGLL
jgi:hypothetical protein